MPNPTPTTPLKTTAAAMICGWTSIGQPKRETRYAAAPTAEPSFSSLEGFIGAKVLVAGLQRASARLSREDLVAGLEQLGNHDVGGFGVVYGPASRTGSTLVDTVLATGTGRFVR